MNSKDVSKKVSIVLPTYNGARYIRQSIESCLNQTYGNIELIIIDDGSTDNTPEIIKSYKEERIKYLRHKKNKGLPYALNTGFSHSTGEYLTWISDDSYYANETIEKMLSFLRTKNCPFVYCDFYRFNESNPSTQRIVELPDSLDLENINMIGACFLYSKEVMKVVGDYDPDTTLAEDYDYWIRTSKKFSMRHLNEPLYFYREREESLSFQFLRQYDVQTVSILVRLKNDIIDLERATEQFINLIAEKNRVLGSKFLRAVSVFISVITFMMISPIKFYRNLAKFRFSKKINKVLADFQMKRISFEKAKLTLKNIVTGRLI